MKINIGLTIILVAFLSSAHSQDTTLLKRKPYNLKVVVDKNTFYEEDLNATPYVLFGNTVQIYPGETVYLEVEQENGVIKSVKAVKKITDSTKTLTISFTQTTEKKVHQMMMLKVTNPFKQQLVYNAKMFLMKQNK